MAAGAFDLKAFYARVDGLYRDGRGDKVYRYLADSLAAARLSGDSLAIVAVASELGGVERVRGNLRQAEALYDEALLVHGRMSSPDAASSANLLINKGDVLVAQGRYAAAVDLFDRAEALLGDGIKTAYQRSARWGSTPLPAATCDGPYPCSTWLTGRRTSARSPRSPLPRPW